MLTKKTIKFSLAGGITPYILISWNNVDKTSGLKKDNDVYLKKKCSSSFQYLFYVGVLMT